MIDLKLGKTILVNKNIYLHICEIVYSFRDNVKFNSSQIYEVSLS